MSRLVEHEGKLPSYLQRQDLESSLITRWLDCSAGDLGL
jgi:hypothetical protein